MRRMKMNTQNCNLNHPSTGTIRIGFVRLLYRWLRLRNYKRKLYDHRLRWAHYMTGQ